MQIITEYTFNGIVGDITTNPLTEPVVLSFTADREVDWVSLKIEKEDELILILKKIKDKGLATGKIIGLAITGSFKGFDVINEV